MKALIVTPKSKKDLTFLKRLLSSLKEVELVTEVSSQNELELELQAAFIEMHRVQEGKSKTRPIAELLYEVRHSKH